MNKDGQNKNLFSIARSTDISGEKFRSF